MVPSPVSSSTRDSGSGTGDGVITGGTIGEPGSPPIGVPPPYGGMFGCVPPGWPPFVGVVGPVVGVVGPNGGGVPFPVNPARVSLSGVPTRRNEGVFQPGRHKCGRHHFIRQVLTAQEL